MQVDRHALRRFVKYTAIGGVTFAFDLLLLWVMTEFLGLLYYVSVALGFLIAVSLNYVLSRRFVFKGTARTVHHGYLYFISIAVAAALFIAASVATLVTVFALDYMIARILVACVVGVCNYLVNLHYNFRVVGLPH